MAKNLVNGTNIIVEENGDNINMNLSPDYLNSLNNQLTNINNSITTKTTYSTNETRVGTWIDNKPIYRKVVTGNLSSGSIAHGLTNVTFVNSYGHFISGSGAFMPLPSLRIGAPDYSCGYYVNATNIIFDKAASASGTVYVTLEYTKNTD